MSTFFWRVEILPVCSHKSRWSLWPIDGCLACNPLARSHLSDHLLPSSLVFSIFFLLYFCFQATLARPVRVSMMFCSTPSIPSTLLLRFPPYLSSTTVARTLIKIRLFCFSNECPFLLFEEIQSPSRYLQSALIAFSQKYENSGDRFADFSLDFCGFVLLLEGTTRAAYFNP